MFILSHDYVNLEFPFKSSTVILSVSDFIMFMLFVDEKAVVHFK